MLPEKVIIEDQTLRDGIQNEDKLLSTDEKIDVIYRLIDAGIKRFQVTSFVNPGKVPQMRDAEELIERLKDISNVSFYGLVLNRKGLERAIKSSCLNVEISISASNTHSLKNTGMTTDHAIKELEWMIKMALDSGLKVRAGVQCAFGCRYEGRIHEDLVIRIVEQEIKLGASEIALADTTGMAHPLQVKKLASRALALAGNIPVFLHLHDTEGKGLVNAFAAMEVGIYCFDVTTAGMGGCPFIPGATGNIAGEDLAFMLQQMNIHTGIDVKKLAETANLLRTIFKKDFPGKVSRVLAARDIKCIF